MSNVLASARVALETLRLNPLRTTLSTLGIIMGAASLAAVLALADGAEGMARTEVEREGLQLVMLRPQTEATQDGLRVALSGFPLFDTATADALAADVGASAGVQLTMDGTGAVAVPGDRPRAVRVRGALGLGVPEHVMPKLTSGRAITDAEARSGAEVVVISQRLADELVRISQPGGRVGEMLALEGSARRVVGIIASNPTEKSFFVLLPFDGAERAMTPIASPRPRSITVHVVKVEEVGRVRDQVDRFAAAQAWDGKYLVQALGRERLDQVARGMLVFKLLMGAFTAISLIVGGIGIMNVLLASILERTREIGVRKAVGARRRDILRQFLVESITIALMGTGAGMVLGFAGAYAVTAYIRAQTQAPFYPTITAPSLALTAIAAIGIGLGAGLYPALRASRLTPVEAILRE